MKWVKLLLNSGVHFTTNATIIPKSTFDTATTAQIVDERRARYPELSVSGYGMGWGRHSYQGHEVCSPRDTRDTALRVITDCVPFWRRSRSFCTSVLLAQRRPWPCRARQWRRETRAAAGCYFSSNRGLLWSSTDSVPTSCAIPTG